MRYVSQLLRVPSSSTPDLPVESFTVRHHVFGTVSSLNQCNRENPIYYITGFLVCFLFCAHFILLLIIFVVAAVVWPNPPTLWQKKKGKKPNKLTGARQPFWQYFPDRGDLGCCGDCAQLWIEFCMFFFSCVRNIFIQQLHKFWQTCPLQLNSNTSAFIRIVKFVPCSFFFFFFFLSPVQMDIPSANWTETTTNLTGSMHFSFLTGTPSRMWCHSSEFHLPSHQKSPSYSEDCMKKNSSTWCHESKKFIHVWNYTTTTRKTFQSRV